MLGLYQSLKYLKLLGCVKATMKIKNNVTYKYDVKMLCNGGMPKKIQKLDLYLLPLSLNRCKNFHMCLCILVKKF